MHVYFARRTSAKIELLCKYCVSDRSCVYADYTLTSIRLAFAYDCRSFVTCAELFFFLNNRKPKPRWLVNIKLIYLYTYFS